jgi:hypothetical protein
VSAPSSAFRPDCDRCRWHEKPCKEHLAEWAAGELVRERRAHAATRRQAATAASERDAMRAERDALRAELARLKGDRA